MIAVLSAADRVGEVPISENSIGSGISENETSDEQFKNTNQHTPRFTRKSCTPN